MQHFDGQYRFIAPDHLGFGDSDKPRGDYYQIDKQAERARYVLNCLGYERAHVVGHSMGGQIALTFAGLYPEAVERLIVVDPAVTGRMHPFAALGLFSMGMVRCGMAGVVETLTRLAFRFPDIGIQLMRMYFPHPTKQRDAALYWGRQIVADGQIHSAAWAQRSIVKWNVTPLLKNISAPTLAIWGVEDYCVPISECAVLEKHIRNFQALCLPAIGHFPMIEAWPDYIEGMANFLA